MTTRDQALSTAKKIAATITDALDVDGLFERARVITLLLQPYVILGEVEDDEMDQLDAALRLRPGNDDAT